MGSLSYMTANACSSWAAANKVQNDLRYRYSGVSLTPGPVWRFNDYVSVYGVIGINYDDYSSHFRQSPFKTGDATATNHSRSELKKTPPAYGAGAQINLVENMVIDLGYEASRFNHGEQTLTRNSLLFGVGYRF
ncbi:MAG: Ail/Lom family outer membrane beta-barrel protein [Sodalis sp. (in: enterobacteria)]|uniref:Ail/Lom family outer membrane beta-barrel protein n=1 Tax=Sodalis sp. (in: enterobacteria) TaxID=1898979 RepID=UPI003F3C5B11